VENIGCFSKLKIIGLNQDLLKERDLLIIDEIGQSKV